LVRAPLRVVRTFDTRAKQQRVMSDAVSNLTSEQDGSTIVYHRSLAKLFMKVS
jgi:hypothetical protein